MNKKGQALIEFVLILPLFIFLIFIIYDLGMIFSHQNKLENTSSDVINLYRSGTSLEELLELYPDNQIELLNDGEYDKVVVTDKVNIITPGLNNVLGDPYIITVERYIYHE